MNFTLNTRVFPEGTSVGAYPASNWSGNVNQNAAPKGSATNSQTVSGGSMTFTGLTSGTQYFAVADIGGGTYRYISFTPDTGTASTPQSVSNDYVCVKDVKAAGAAGGTFTSGAWRTRDLNTVSSDTGSNVTVGSNQMTLKAGTYRCRASAPADAVDQHQARLRNITAGATLLVGTSEVNTQTVHSSARSWIVGRFTLAVDSVVEVQHRCATTRTTQGFGYPSSFDESSVYTVVELWKE